MEKRIFFITQEGLQNVRRELNELIESKSLKLKNAPQLANLGDVSPEYLLFYQEIGMIDVKIEKLRNILKNASIISVPESNNTSIIQPGATVVVKNNGRKNRFQLTGTVEADPADGKISVSSPLGAALLGHRAGDEIFVPAARAAYKILSIQYGMA